MLAHLVGLPESSSGLTKCQRLTSKLDCTETEEFYKEFSLMPRPDRDDTCT